MHRELARLAGIRWLFPDAAMAALADDARTWLHERFDELLAVLTPWAEGAPLPDALALSATRSMHEAERCWHDAWRGGDEGTSPVLRALVRAEASIGQTHSKRLRHAVAATHVELARRVPDPDARWRSLTTSCGAFEQLRGDPPVTPGTRLLRRHLAWMAVHGDARPSPFAPLLAVWQRGAWPILLPGAAALVYVPAERDHALQPWVDGDPEALAEPEAPSRHGPRRRPNPAVRRFEVPAWWELGVSIAPAFVRVELRDMEITAGAAVPVGAYPIDEG